MVFVNLPKKLRKAVETIAEECARHSSCDTCPLCADAESLPPMCGLDTYTLRREQYPYQWMVKDDEKD